MKTAHDKLASVEGDDKTRPGNGPKRVGSWKSCAVVMLTLLLVVTVVWAWVRFRRTEQLRQRDARIAADVEQLVLAQLRDPPLPDDLARQCGPFLKLTKTRWDRPQCAWQLVERLDFHASAEFRDAHLDVYVGIDGGTLCSWKLS